MENIVISKVYEFTLDTKNSKPTKANIFPNLLDSVLFKINVTENNLPKTLTNSTISLLIVKESGTVVRQTENINIADDIEGIVEINLKSSCVDEIGLYMAQLTISDQDEAIRTGRFIYNVSPIIDGDIIEDAQDKVSVLDELEKRIDELNDRILENEGFSGDYNDLINKPLIPTVDVNKAYVDNELSKKSDKAETYVKSETYSKSEVDGQVDGLFDDVVNELGLYAKKTELDGKVDKVVGKGLSTNDFTNEEKMKLEILKNYVHPNDANTRHITDADRLVWSEKAEKTIVTNSSNGLMTPALKMKLDGISTNANNYNHPSTHPASMIIQDSYNRFVTDEDIIKWNMGSNFDGDYNDLLNKPTIPTKLSELTNDSNLVDEDYVNYKCNEVMDAIPQLDLANYYSKGDIDYRLTTKSDIGHIHSLDDIEGLNIDGGIDLSNYATKAEVNLKVNKVTGKSLVSDTEIARLSTVTNYDDTGLSNSINGLNIAIGNKSDVGHSHDSQYSSKASEHTHINLSVIDGITTQKISEWDAKSTFGGSYYDLSDRPSMNNIPALSIDATNSDIISTLNKLIDELFKTGLMQK